MKANTLTALGVLTAVTVSATAIYIGLASDTEVEVQVIRETVYLPAPTTTSTSTTTTTTTTLAIPVEQAKVIPVRSELVRKVDEIYPGASNLYGADTIEKAGVFACKRWNEAPITRLNVIRDILEYTGIDDIGFGHAVAEAVVWTICWENRSFPNGPREYR